MTVTEIKETPHIHRDPGPCFLRLRLRSGDPRTTHTLTVLVQRDGCMHARAPMRALSPVSPSRASLSQAETSKRPPLNLTVFPYLQLLW